MRSFWKGDDGFLPAFSRRVLGSADIFEHQGRKPWASVNFVTAHDGFTLADLWSYNHKHNEANDEGNRDGHDDNRSWNCGVEGPTDDPASETRSETGLVRLGTAALRLQGNRRLEAHRRVA